MQKKTTKKKLSAKSARRRARKDRFAFQTAARPEPTPKNVDPTSADTLIGKIAEYDIGQLIGIWSNAVERLGDPKKPEWHDRAQRALEAINAELERRTQAALDDPYFKWPSTDAPGGNGDLANIDALSEGLLGFFGYHVGRTNGLADGKRRRLLREIFLAAVPPVFPRDYLESCGKPESSARLRKMAHIIASLARNFKRRQSEKFDDAIADWEQDLNYLYETYYVGKFKFDWPEM